MRVRSRRLHWSLVAVPAVALASLLAAPTAGADVRFKRVAGFDEPSTPEVLDRVGILKVGPRKAGNVLVLNPGTSASAAYFRPLARFVVREANRRRGRRLPAERRWQVWAAERRENQLEDQSMIDRVKQGEATPLEAFDYYLRHLTDPSITEHFELIDDADVPFGRQWGMRTTVMDLREVVRRAQRKGRKVVLGGHSLGGSITTAYATWDFNGTPGAEGLSGLVYIDGGSNPEPITPEQASQRLADLEEGSPWLTFGDIAAPFAGLFNVVGSTAAVVAAGDPNEFATWPLAPDNLVPPVPVTNAAQYGFALDVETSPPALRAAQANLGRLAGSGDPRPWDNADELTPLRRYAKMFSGTGELGLDGTAWYHPQRLTDDSGAVAAGNANPAQEILDLRATHGDDLGRDLRIYAFGAGLGGEGVLAAARVLAEQSGIPEGRLTLVNRQDTYAHNDPNSAFPDNVFVDRLKRFLRKVQRGK